MPGYPTAADDRQRLIVIDATVTYQQCYNPLPDKAGSQPAASLAFSNSTYAGCVSALLHCYTVIGISTLTPKKISATLESMT